MFNIPDDSVEALRRKYAEIDAQQARWDRYYDEYQEWATEAGMTARTLGVLAEALQSAIDSRRRGSVEGIVEELDCVLDRLITQVDNRPREPEDD